MHLNLLIGLIVLSIVSLPLRSQEENNTTVDDYQAAIKKEKAYSPTIGVGAGTIAFFGDIKDNNYGHPFTSNFGYNVFVTQPVTDFLSVNFSILFSKVRVEERDIQQFMNFESDLTGGSVNFQYNFSHFIPAQRKLTPFVSVGIEMLEFNPKSDLKLGSDDYYQLWSDGTLRNIAENSTNAENSIILQRDYTYETDLREEGFSDKHFSKTALAFPIGAGVIMHLNDQFNFKVGTYYHISTTDYMDGVTPKTSSDLLGNFKGNSRNDHFLFTNFSLTYNFQKVPPGKYIPYEEDESRPEEYIDYAIFDPSDYDGDGVIDFLDRCPNTPTGVSVDENGCPVDTDVDGIPDYKDEEPNSSNPNMVNSKGVQLSDEEIQKAYHQFIDSTGQYAEVVSSKFSGEIRKKTDPNKKYRIKIGEVDGENESPEQMEKMLGLSDLRVEKKNGKTIYTVGNYDQLQEVYKRKRELDQQGLNNIVVLEKNKKGEYFASNQAAPVMGSAEDADSKISTEDQVVFRVQLGAFKNKPTAQTYKNISSLMVTESGGYYRYMSGAFTNFNEAAKHKVKMIVEGYKGAFIVAYKDGERVPLKSVGIDAISTSPLIGN